MTPVTMAWLAEVGIVTWRSVRKDKRPPIPSELLATFIAFGSLSLLSNNAKTSTAANLTAWGLVIATFMNFVDPVNVKAAKQAASPQNSGGK